MPCPRNQWFWGHGPSQDEILGSPFCLVMESWVRSRWAYGWSPCLHPPDPLVTWVEAQDLIKTCRFVSKRFGGWGSWCKWTWIREWSWLVWTKLCFRAALHPEEAKNHCSSTLRNQQNHNQNANDPKLTLPPHFKAYFSPSKNTVLNLEFTHCEFLGLRLFDAMMFLTASAQLLSIFIPWIWPCMNW